MGHKPAASAGPSNAVGRAAVRGGSRDSHRRVRCAWGVMRVRVCAPQQRPSGIGPLHAPDARRTLPAPSGRKSSGLGTPPSTSAVQPHSQFDGALGNSLCGSHPHQEMGMTSDGRTSEGPAHFMLRCQGRRERFFSVSGAEALSRGLCESRPGNSRWRRGRERTTPSGAWREGERHDRDGCVEVREVLPRRRRGGAR